MSRDRFNRTVEKTRCGGLPAATDVRPAIQAGDGNRCHGCGEAIDPADQLYAIRVVIPLRFHDVCYTAWATFTR